MDPDIYLLALPPESRSLFEAALSEMSCEWQAVTSLRDLARRARRRSLVFLPLATIGFDGLATLRGKLPTAEVVVIGSNGTVEETMQAMRHGAVDYICPPVEEQEVMQAVRRWQERRTLVEEGERLSEIITLMELGRALTSNLHLDQLYEQINDLVERAFSPDTISLMLLNPQGERLRLVAQRGLPPRATAGAEVTLEESIAGKVVREGEPQLLLGGLEGTSFSSLARRGRHIVSAMSIPLQVQGKTIGVINVNRYRGRSTYTQHDANLLHVFASQIAIAIKNAQLYASLREERDRIIKAQEDVRHELARDLHDGLTQVLARMALDLDFLRSQLGSGLVSIEAAQEELSSLRSVTRQAIHDTRTMMFALRPLVLETRGLVPALEQYLTAMRESDKRARYQLIYENGQQIRQLAPSTARIVFAILQEAINNARKHAQASAIIVTLKCEEDAQRHLLASVGDDGLGFNVKQVEGSYEERYSFGLLNMKERAELIDAELRIDSSKEGTLIHMDVPWRIA